MPPLIVAVIAVALMVGLVVLIAMIVFKGKRSNSNEELANMTIDVSQLPSHGPDGVGPQLELFGTAVRIAVIVIAPAGRGSELPSRFNLPGVIDGVVPGLMELVTRHEPVFRRWPQQLSVQGFIHSFASNMELPGERGHDTPWASIAGRVQVGGHSLLLGMILCSEDNNNMGYFTAEHAGQWLDALRIRK